MITSPTFTYLSIDNYDIHVTEWGDASNEVLVMWHGLARTGRDFDDLAMSLSDQYYVLCPDALGRGRSSWASDPQQYSMPYYLHLATALLDQYAIEQCHWLGTSLGGLIGMGLAADPQQQRLRSLTINDIGPEIPAKGLNRILDYTVTMPRFKSITEAECWLRNTYQSFGEAPDSYWQRMARTSVRRCHNGELSLHYDPAIVSQFPRPVSTISAWDTFTQIRLPTQLFWGQQSDILTEFIVDRMLSEMPSLDVTTFNDCGHAPNLTCAKSSQKLRHILNKAAYS